MAALVRREVQHDGDRGGKVDGQRGEQRPQGVDPAGAGTDVDDIAMDGHPSPRRTGCRSPGAAPRGYAGSGV
jgi:hypothetical protein